MGKPLSKSFVILMLTGFTSFAHTALSKDSKLHVHLFSTDVDEKKAKDAMPGAEIHSLESDGASRRVVLPIPEQEALFKKSGLSPFTDKMDRFDKDMLVRYMRSYDAAYVVSKYKGLPLGSVKAAQKLLKN